jgi:hypothetical protein
MQYHVIAAIRRLQAHRRELMLGFGLVCVSGLLFAAAPVSLLAVAIERQVHHRRRRRRQLWSVLLFVFLLRTAHSLWRSLRRIPNRPWHPCAQCGKPIQAPSRAKYCDNVCRKYARLERAALDDDTRVAAHAERRLRNMRFRELALTNSAWDEVPF